MSRSEYQIVFMTASSENEAERIALALVENGLVACVNIVDKCRSIYRWKGETVNDTETMMFAKTRRENFDEIVRMVSALHSYDVPEIIAADLTSLSKGYGAFLRDILGG